MSEGDHTQSETPASLDGATGFLSNILTPGSSLNPTFLRLLDGAFALLLCVFLALLFLTRGSFHIVALIAIEGCLWGSVKWFVAELQRTVAQMPVPGVAKEKEE